MKEPKFLIQIDSIGYTNKPNGAEIAKIKSRAQGSKPQELTSQQILNKIQKGHSFSLGVLRGGLKAENWVMQQIFGIDIDNENQNELILTPKKALEILKSKGIKVFGIYYSFSSTKDKPKFRILVALDKPVADEAQRKIITKALFSIFPQADTSCMNADRIFFGTNKNAKFSTQVNSFEQFLEIYNLNEEAATETIHLSELDKLKNEFDFENYLVNELQLEVLSENDNSIKIKRCPVCSHNDCFVYYKNTKTFYCYGQHGSKGGSIIDFLMITKKLSRKEAIDYFKKELCHIKEEVSFSKDRVNKLDIISAKILIEKKLQPPFCCIDNFIFQGVTLLAAPPKYRKSWLALLMCTCVASGEEFLGFKTLKSPTLYLDLEDSYNRLQHRINKILDGRKVPENFDVSISAGNLETGLIETLEEHIKQKPDTKLIIIDTLQKIRMNIKNQNAYSKDYADLSQLKSFADKHGICIVIVHHVKKGNRKKEDYVFDQISGTNGIMGAVDTMIVLNDFDKDLSQATLHITGRDVESDELTLQFNNGNCRWSCLGNAEIQLKKRERKEYDDNPLVIGVKRLLKDSEEWQGEATQLKELLLKQNVYFDYTPAVMAKKLKKLTEKFSEYDNIDYTAPPENGSNGHRIHKFKRASFDIAITDDIDDIEDLFM